MSEFCNIAISRPSTGEEEWQALREPLMSGWLTQGPRVAAFEKAFAERHQVQHALAATSCTTALHLILAAMEIGPGDEVIVPAFTWVATANVVLYCGAKPVFVDVDRATFNIDPARIAEKVTSRTRAIIAVHLFGLCADIDAIANAAPGVAIIEDAACAAGAAYKGRSAGALGFAAAFSFHPRKSITTGEGGMVTTNDAVLARRIQMLRNHGAEISEEERHSGPKPYLLPQFNLLGYNYRMTDLQGAVGLVQLRKLDSFIAERQAWADFYCQKLNGLAWLQTPATPKGYSHGWQSFVCYVDESKAPAPRDAIIEKLYSNGINARPGTHQVPLLGYYRKRFGFDADDFPIAYGCEQQSLAIPLHNMMSKSEYHHIVDTLNSFDKGN
ncbi:MAG TPA: DegT/DnrJ/EryC1/StrS family aminotransferase [Pyrinomonadaceae bacterium]|nr:DegT/DnrJ/EryC1/StrS family aminotransferase [Pyrinomonadaceae bacterium]